MSIFTIGFTKKNAAKFFGLIQLAGVKTVIDVRLNNISQLAGFAKQDDLKFFLKELNGTDYIYAPELAPTKNILDPYKKGELTWEAYEDKFLNLMAQRNIENQIRPELLDKGCLLCSEHEPHLCHRRLIVEYLNDHTDLNLSVKHLI